MILDQPQSAITGRDICIVGSGPAGMALALECAALGLSVVILESGDLKPTRAIVDASRAEIVDPTRHSSMDLAVVRALGGTSWTWGGRCVPFDDVDFAARAHVAQASWPIRHDDIIPWYTKAFGYLDCGTGAPPPPPDYGRLDGRCSCDQLERWSKQPQLGSVHQKKLDGSPAITVHLNSTVVDLAIDDATNTVAAVVA